MGLCQRRRMSSAILTYKAMNTTDLGICVLAMGLLKFKVISLYMIS
ncbi:hypothetical protein CLV36_104199 [Laceyella sediminis]|uniref:Uncharacterized protein n=1 Tax=Laceyella sediminis TaxID=573074 RepID=A0ABX5EQC9_9BACL|nr:hypothetical protein CLV36_104199 [Laceyella sediminis]